MLGAGKTQRRRPWGTDALICSLTLSNPPTQHQVGVSWGPGRTGGNHANGVMGESRVLVATPCPSGGGVRGRRGQGSSWGEGAWTGWSSVAGDLKKESGTTVVAEGFAEWLEGRQGARGLGAANLGAPWSEDTRTGLPA